MYSYQPPRRKSSSWGDWMKAALLSLTLALCCTAAWKLLQWDVKKKYPVVRLSGKVERFPVEPGSSAMPAATCTVVLLSRNPMEPVSVTIQVPSGGSLKEILAAAVHHMQDRAWAEEHGAEPSLPPGTRLLSLFISRDPACAIVNLSREMVKGQASSAFEELAMLRALGAVVEAACGLDTMTVLVDGRWCETLRGHFRPVSFRWRETGWSGPDAVEAAEPDEARSASAGPTSTEAGGAGR